MTTTNVKRVASLWVIALAATLGVLALPWIMPVHVRAIDSLSQAMGFSNRTAVICAVAGAILLALVACMTRRAPADPFVSAVPADGSARLGWYFVAVVAAGSALLVLAMGAALGGRTALDSTYFVDRMLYIVNGSAPYSQFEFSYGPLMLYPQTGLYLVLRHLGVSASWAYYVWLAGVQALGVVVASYVIDRLEIASRSTKRWLLIALVVVDAPLLALNESLLRFVLAYALLLAVLGFARRSGFRPAAAALAIASVALTALVSPEQGIALLVGMLAAFSIPAWHNIPGSRGALAVLSVGGAAVAALVSRFPMLAWTATGTFNLPILPGTPELVFLAALFTVAIGVGNELEPADVDRAPVLVGWFAVGLVLVSAAFGRADGMHVFLNSIGLLLGATAIVSRRRMAVAWVAAGALMFAVVTYGWSLSDSSVQYFRPRVAQNQETQIAGLSGISHIAFVGPLSGPLGEDLALRRALVPTYGWHMYDASEVSRVLSQTAAAQYLVVPTAHYRKYSSARPPAGGYTMTLPTASEGARRALILYGVPMATKVRHPTLDGPGSLFPALLAQFTFERSLGDLTLLRRR